MKNKIFVANILLIAGIMVACGNNGQDQRIQNEEISQESENAEETSDDSIIGDSVNPSEEVSNSSDRKEYENGDVIGFTSGLKVTIIDSGVYSKPDILDSNIVEKYAFLEVDIENTGDKDIAITGSLFKFYADGYALKNVYLYEDEELPLTSDLSPGRKVKGRVYATGENIDSSECIEAELGDAVIRIYEYDDGSELLDTEEKSIDEYLGALYSIYNGDEQVNLYLDDAGKLCVWNGYGGADEPFYAQTYDAYKIEDNALYGYAGDFIDIFAFQEDGIVEGHVEVLLAGDGSNHYQTYIQEEEYFSTDWRAAFGFE